MIDSLLNFGSAFNWVTPLLAFFFDLLFGSACDFGVIAFAGWDRVDIQYLLKINNVKYWGMMYNYDGDILMFTVRNGDAEFTHDLLIYFGVPIEYTPFAGN